MRAKSAANNTSNRLGPIAEADHWFWTPVRANRKTYIQVALAAAMINIFSLASSLFIMTVYDRVIPNDAIESLIALSIGMGIVLVFDFILKTLRGRFIDLAGGDVDARAGEQIFHKILGLKLGERSGSTGAMISTVREFESIRDFFTSASLAAVVDLPFILLFLLVILGIGGWLAILPALAVPAVIVAGLLLQPLLARFQEDGFSLAQDKFSVLVETLAALETVKATGARAMLEDRWERAVDAQVHLGQRSRRITQLALHITMSAQQIAQVGVVVLGVFLIRDGSLSVGALIACVILTGRALAPLGNLASVLARMNQALTAFGKLDSLMAAQSDVEEGRAYVRRNSLLGAIEFRTVVFSYPQQSERALQDVSFSLGAGEKMAVLGRIGSGKSTLIRLILGLYEPEKGSVLIDGADIRQLHPDDLGTSIGMLPQEVQLFSGSLKENITLGRSGIGDEEMLNAALISGVSEFVGATAAGYDRVLKDRGEGLSGGQKQTIALARAIVTDPPILLMDEPTSAMDTMSERALVERIKPVVASKSLIIVTHRPALLELVDKILVLDRGRVAAFGPRDEVLEALKSKGGGK